MFREREKLQKLRKTFKKKNYNKDQFIIKDDDGLKINSYMKVIQQKLIKDYNLKIQINDLRNINYLKEDKIIGNSNVKDVRIAINEIEKNGLIPYDAEFKHDMTRWSSSKKKQKEKNRRKIEKMEKNHF
jgi:hypothetical protein